MIGIKNLLLGLVLLAVTAAVFVITACDDPEFEACLAKYLKQEEICMDTCADARDECKAPCMEQYPEYMNCYWDCRVENRNDTDQAAGCLLGCADDFDPTGEAVACVENCDATYDTCEAACFKRWWESDEKC